MPVVCIRDLVVEYRSAGYPVRPLDGLDADADDGELTLLLGPSGSGKTTLLSCLGGILRPSEGTLEVDGIDLAGADDDQLMAYRRSRVGFVFQAFNLIPSLTALDNVAAPLVLTGTRRAVARDRAADLLERVDMADRARHLPHQLSGGQQQRVAIARGLAADPPVLLADEPTANLDYVQAEAVVVLLRDLAVAGRTVIVSSHDDRLLPVVDRVIRLVPEPHAAEAPGPILLPAGATLFRQGSRGDLVYLVERGTLELVRERTDGTTRRLALRTAGSYFGELGPMIQQPRTATARAVTDAVVVSMTLQEFRTRMRHAAAEPQRG